MTTLHEWMQTQPSEADGGPCQEARDWVEANKHLSLEQMGEALADHPSGLDWLWWLAQYLGLDLAPLGRQAALRALRIYAPTTLDRARRPSHAALLRALPDDCDMPGAARLAWLAVESQVAAASAWDASARPEAAASATGRAAKEAGAEAEEYKIQCEALAPLVLAALRERGVV